MRFTRYHDRCLRLRITPQRGLLRGPRGSSDTALRGPALSQGTIGNADRHPRTPPLGSRLQNGGRSRSGQPQGTRRFRVDPEEIGMLIYGGVCRDNIEPATACAVSHGLNLPPQTQVFDVSNACLGVLNGMVLIANAIELGQIRAGLIAACETSREIIDITVDQLNASCDMNFFKKNIATLTGGSGAVAVLLTEASLSRSGHRLIGGTVRHANEHHKLCLWGAETDTTPDGRHFIETDSMGILSNGVRLGKTPSWPSSGNSGGRRINPIGSFATRWAGPIKKTFSQPSVFLRKKTSPPTAISATSARCLCR